MGDEKTTNPQRQMFEMCTFLSVEKLLNTDHRRELVSVKAFRFVPRQLYLILENNVTLLFLCIVCFLICL